MLKALLTIGALQLATMLVLLARTKLLAVFLGPEAVGLMAVIDKLVAVAVQVASLSLPYAALRFLPELWETDRIACHRTLRSMALTLGALALLAGAAGSVLSFAAPSAWGTQLLAHPALVAAAFATVPAAVFAPFVQSAMAGVLRHRSSMLIGLAHAGVMAASALCAAVFDSLIALYLFYAAAALVLLGPALARVLRIARPPAPTPMTPLTRLRDALPAPRILRFSAALFTLSVLAPYAALLAHYLVFDLHGASAAGYMQAAIGISLAVRGVLGSAHQVYLTPHISKGGPFADRLHWAARFQTLWCVIAAIVVPPLLMLADVAIALLYADSFLPATRYVHLFVFAELVTLVSGTWQGLIVAAGRLRFHVLQNVGAQLLFAGIAWTLVPRIGIDGAALGAISAPLFLYACTSGYLRWQLGVSPPLRTTLLSLWVLLALAGIGQLGAAGTPTSLAAALPLLGAYAALLAGVALLIGADGRHELLRIAAGVLRRTTGRPRPE